MTEWEVFGVIIAVIGFVSAIVTPLVKLTKSITELTTVVEHLSNEVTQQKKQSVESHTKLWSYNVKQDDQLNDHETRISLLEQLNK